MHQACLLLALAAIWRAQLPWIIALTASVLLAGTLFLQWRRAAVLDAPTLQIMIPPGDETVWVDGVPVDDLRVSWQGPLVQLRWRGEEGVMRRLFWPDVLGPAERRELRLAIRARRVPRRTPSMAP